MDAATRRQSRRIRADSAAPHAAILEDRSHDCATRREFFVTSLGPIGRARNPDGAAEVANKDKRRGIFAAFRHFHPPMFQFRKLHRVYLQ
ncbi:MAG TPA: hypothetical protein PKA57_02725 [Parvibaculum sp.]|uniref:hypothetical protein n=1 Tax=Parvibaculum sp. TaxID=2024848 RepID=UPI002CF4A35C|nr:hypothetical protein [Parvibaculum sp.]HMM13514.1 hypothetical protein [Parvibaculum sp.]